MYSNGKPASGGNWVRLKIGGEAFLTTKQTLMREPNSTLARICQDKENLFMKDANGSYLIDHDPEFFPHVLSYLRSGKVPSPRKISREALMEEADFYNLESLAELLNQGNSATPSENVIVKLNTKSGQVSVQKADLLDYDELSSELKITETQYLYGKHEDRAFHTNMASVKVLDVLAKRGYVVVGMAAISIGEVYWTLTRRN